MYALVDAVGMYASAEKIFDPTIRKRPVLVLSNNDGTVVALCPIAKAAGFKKFAPFFQIDKSQLERTGAVIRSSNYALYADISNRMMSTCAKFAPEIHTYSIDECFLHYPYTNKDDDWLWSMGTDIRRTVWKDVRLPVGVGFGPTPTLSKAANHAAKKLPGFRGVAVANSVESRRDILEQMDVTDVWGIGARLGKRLKFLGIHNGWQLASQEPTRMRKFFNINVENTVRELNGEVRLSWDQSRPDKKEIYSTRSFGQRITDRQQLKFALATHAETVATKLRKQNGLASACVVFAHSSPYDSEPYYRKQCFHQFVCPTQDTRNFIKAADDALATIYKPGVLFSKCGIGLLDLSGTQYTQDDLFAPPNDDPTLMQCLDSINHKYGRDALHFASRGVSQDKSGMRRNHLSKCATTRWTDIPSIKC